MWGNQKLFPVENINLFNVSCGATFLNYTILRIDIEMKQSNKLLSAEMSKFLFRRELNISPGDFYPIKHLEVFEDNKLIKEFPYSSKNEIIKIHNKVRTDFVREKNLPWEDHILIKPKNENDSKRNVLTRVKIFKVWEIALTIYFDFLLQNDFKEHRMKAASIFNRQIQRKGYRGYKTAKDIKKGYRRWLFNFLNPCRNKTDNQTPLIINWTIVWLRDIELPYSNIAKILNSLAPWSIHFTERKLILRYGRLDKKFYNTEFPCNMSAGDIYKKFSEYYRPPPLLIK